MMTRLSSRQPQGTQGALPALRARRGVTLSELLVALVIVSIIGTALTSIFLSQSRFYARDDAERQARQSTRGGLNVILSDLRMVDADSGVIAPTTSKTVTVRVAYAMGLVCAVSGSDVTVARLPVDSLIYNYPPNAVIGYAVRDTTGFYKYSTGAVTKSENGTVSNCTGGTTPIDTVPTGKVITLGPTLPGLTSANVAQVVVLYRTITYAFADSKTLPGKTALWRITKTTGGADSIELAAPYDTSARFRFYVGNADAAQDSPPAALTKVRGLELRLNALSESNLRVTGQPALAKSTTAVFFQNRLF
jgi:prepilin-type N-terminal cleavage/methylation domain-containing protein